MPQQRPSKALPKAGLYLPPNLTLHLSSAITQPDIRLEGTREQPPSYATLYGVASSITSQQIAHILEPPPPYYENPPTKSQPSCPATSTSAVAPGATVRPNTFKAPQPSYATLHTALSSATGPRVAQTSARSEVVEPPPPYSGQTTAGQPYHPPTDARTVARAGARPRTDDGSPAPCHTLNGASSSIASSRHGIKY